MEKTSTKLKRMAVVTKTNPIMKRNPAPTSYARLMDIIDTIPDFADREDARRLLPHVVVELAFKWMQEHKSICLCYGSGDKICEQKHKD